MQQYKVFSSKLGDGSGRGEKAEPLPLLRFEVWGGFWNTLENRPARGIYGRVWFS